MSREDRMYEMLGALDRLGPKIAGDYYFALVKALQEDKSWQEDAPPNPAVHETDDSVLASLGIKPYDSTL